MIPELYDAELAGDPVLYKGQWYQPYYGPLGMVEFFLIKESAE